MKLKLLLTGFLFLGSFVLVPSAYAALDLTVSPVFLNYSPKPGDSISDKITLHNNSIDPITLNLSVVKMAINNQGDIVPEDIPASDSATKWIKFTSSKLTAPAKEWLEVPVTIDIPKDAAYGNYFALVFSAAGSKTTSGASVQGNVLVPVLLNVKKAGAIAKADIAEFSVKNFVTEYLPVEFTLAVKNTGNFHLAPKGNIFIRAQNSTTDTAVLDINPNSSFVLPSALKTFNTAWTDSFITKNSDGKLQISWNKLTSFRLGKYTAHALLVYDDGNRDIPIESTISFWVIPYTAIGIIVIGILLTLIIVNLTFKSMVKKEAQKISTSK